MNNEVTLMEAKPAVESYYRIMRVNTFEAKFSWIIPNFGCRQYVEKFIVSTTFSPASCNSIVWRLILLPRGKSGTEDYVSVLLELVNSDQPVVKTHFRVCIVDINGRRVCRHQSWRPHWFHGGQQKGYYEFIRRDYLLEPANGFLSAQGALNLVCRVLSSVSTLDDSRMKIEAGIASSQQLSAVFQRLLEDASFSDVTLEVRGGVKFPAHKCILAARSSVFATMFATDNQENVIKLDDVDADVLKAMLEYLYTSRIVDIEAKAGELIGLADRYALKDLKSRCETVLGKDLTVENVAEKLRLADLYEAKTLRRKTLRFVTGHLQEVIETPGFKTASISRPDIMEKILKHVAKQPIDDADSEEPKYFEKIKKFVDEDVESDWDYEI